VRFPHLIAALLLAACSDSPSRDPSPRPPNGPEFERTAIRIHTERLSPRAARLTVLTASGMKPSPLYFRVEWRLDGEIAPWAGNETQTTVSVGEHYNGVWYPETVSHQVWQATLRPLRQADFALTATATTAVTLTTPCRAVVKWAPACDAVPYPVAITMAVPADAAAARGFLTAQTALQFFPAATGAVHARAERYFSLLVMKQLDADPATPVDYDPPTFVYRPDRNAGYEPYAVLDRVCVDYALIGAACYHTFVADIDNDPVQAPASFAPEDVTYTVSKLENAWIVAVDLKLALDVLMEPPAEATLADVPNDLANPSYERSEDLSTYIKAFGRAGVAVHAVFEIDTATPKTLRYRLRAWMLTDVLSVALHRGPFCHNNLGTVYGSTVTFATSYANAVALPAPFVNGVPLYPGLVSDADTTGVLLAYYAADQGPYPHAASSPCGGSGAGRDALGVGVRAFAYGADNPNSCRRPADACSDAGVQDGGPEWSGVSANCQYPNVSDDGDDATYRISTLLVPGPSICVPEACGGAAHEITSGLSSPWFWR
jgi:hypothetical protein